MKEGEWYLEELSYKEYELWQYWEDHTVMVAIIYNQTSAEFICEKLNEELKT